MPTEQFADAASNDGEAAPAARHDGLDGDRKAAFLHRLAQTGSVTEACEAAGMSRQGAYALRNRAEGRAFALAGTRRLAISPPRRSRSG